MTDQMVRFVERRQFTRIKHDWATSWSDITDTRVEPYKMSALGWGKTYPLLALRGAFSATPELFVTKDPYEAKSRIDTWRSELRP